MDRFSVPQVYFRQQTSKAAEEDGKMPSNPLVAPQLIANARMLYLDWVPEDPAATRSLVPEGLKPEARGCVYLNQYIVDDPAQTSNGGLPGSFGAYSLTYLGVDLEGLDAQPSTPGRWWTHYFNSSPDMIDYALQRGVLAAAGETVFEWKGDELIATTLVGGKPVIRTSSTARVGAGAHANGQLRYVTRVDGVLVSGRYPFVMKAAVDFKVSAIEFLDKSHPVYALRPKQPLDVTFGFYSPDITFCYPGGEGPLNTKPHGV
ncbi:hypothetical protein ONR75_10235 [Rhodopseudomonas sp. P2A-2r]|uniref:hypothetical protein n=1 Tax=Rhodopseudomonas sp. P2A-2r TaxID=2991972 RepID=UPI002234C23A|nr:hypothetical protein [Rhodopseudomonas sp. P2A-2r]UZE50961.1 hypothetical protein ONR75_10235 [Rhodopseudomonas sp. P2A-2r]